MKVIFERVEYRHKAKDTNGKWKQKTFWATINPFNKNSQGQPKTRQEIIDSLKLEAKEWEENLKSIS